MFVCSFPLKNLNDDDLKGIVRLVIEDTDNEEELIEYYLVNPSREKLELMQALIEDRYDDYIIINDVEYKTFEGMWDVDEFVKKNFETIEVTALSMGW